MFRSRRGRAAKLLTIGALIVPAAILTALGLGLTGQLEALGRRSWREYGQYLADLSIANVEQRLWDAEQRLMMSARADPPEGPGGLPDLLAALGANPAYELVFGLQPDGGVLFPSGTTWEARTAAPVVRALEPVLEAIGSEAAGPAPIHHLAGADRGRPFQVTYFSLRSWSGDLLGAIVLVWDLGYAREVILPQMLVHGPPAGKGAFHAGYLRDHISICLIDERGEVVFENRPQPGAGLIAELNFRSVLSFWRLGVRLEDDEYRAWVGRVRTAHLALMVAMLAVIALGGFALWRWVRREIELAELKSRFVSDVSHELKTPIALIRLYAETLELGRVREPGRMQEFLQVISRESKRLSHLINNVLDLSRIEAGRKTYRFTTEDLSRIVRETLDAYRYQLDLQGFVVDEAIEPGPLTVRVDSEAVTQALINLLDNAVKYSDGSRAIEVALAKRGDRALLSVRDHGIGIAAAEQKLIFDQFYRVDDELVQAVRGSGLGLTLVRHVVEAHGGVVGVHSKLGEGSTFTIELPLGGGMAS